MAASDDLNRIPTSSTYPLRTGSVAILLVYRCLLSIVLALTLLICSGCGGEHEDRTRYSVKAVDNEAALPYHFVVERKETRIYLEKTVAVDWDADGFDEFYRLQSGKYAGKPVSSVIFYPDVADVRALSQHNVDASTITSDVAYDFNGNGLKEVAITYSSRDTVWLAFVSAREGEVYRRAVAYGIDRDGNGLWDGKGYIAALHDVNGDSHVEILFAINVGFDLYERTLTCLDWHNDSVLWRFEVAGAITRGSVHIIAEPGYRETLIIIGVNSKDNAAVVDDMDDQHGYVICLNRRGDLIWKRVTGERFSNPVPLPIQYDPDIPPEILMINGGGQPDASASRSPMAGNRSSLVVCDLQGKTLDSLPLEPGSGISEIVLGDIDYKGEQPVFVVLTGARAIRIYDQRLNVLAECTFDVLPLLYGYRDLLAIGRPQFLVNRRDHRLQLLSPEFELLAQLSEVGTGFPAQVFRSQSTGWENGLILNTKDSHEGFVLTLAKTPWYTVFSRHPILAFAAAFVPLSGIVAIIWVIMLRFRQKNRLIGEQRDRLELTLEELRDTQERLIAAEKFRQARDIAGGVAHEIHNAVYPAIASLDTLKRRLEDAGALSDSKNSELLELTDGALSRAVAMTDLVREYLRLESELSPDSLPLHEVFDAIADTNAERITVLGVKWSVTLEDDAAVKCRKAHAFSLFNNLIVNALDAMADVDRRELTVSAVRDDMRVLVQITDTGHGVPQDDRKRIYNAFYSTKPQSGTGLGLAIVRRIVELYNGSITISSDARSGTRFAVTLPAAETTRADKEQLQR